MTDFNKINQAQIIAGENAVIASLKAKGLIPQDDQSDESLLFFNLFREVRNEIATEDGYVLRDAIRITFDRFMKNRVEALAIDLQNTDKRFTLTELKDIMFRHEMKYHIFKPETTKEFSPEEIEKFTKYHIDDWLISENIITT